MERFRLTMMGPEPQVPRFCTCRHRDPHSSTMSAFDRRVVMCRQSRRTLAGVIAYSGLSSAVSLLQTYEVSARFAQVPGMFAHSSPLKTHVQILRCLSRTGITAPMDVFVTVHVSSTRGLCGCSQRGSPVGEGLRRNPGCALGASQLDGQDDDGESGEHERDPVEAAVQPLRHVVVARVLMAAVGTHPGAQRRVARHRLHGDVHLQLARHVLRAGFCDGEFFAHLCWQRDA